MVASILVLGGKYPHHKTAAIVVTGVCLFNFFYIQSEEKYYSVSSYGLGPIIMDSRQLEEKHGLAQADPKEDHGEVWGLEHLLTGCERVRAFWIRKGSGETYRDLSVLKEDLQAGSFFQGV